MIVHLTAVFQLAVTLEQSGQLNELTQLTQHVAAQQVTLSKLISAGAQSTACESGTLSVRRTFFLRHDSPLIRR